MANIPKNGILASNIINMPNRTVEERLRIPLNERYIGVVFEGSTFPDKPYKNDLTIELRPAEKNEYLPILNKVAANEPKGLKLLMTCMTHQEGFYGNTTNGIKKGSRSYKTNNPGNIGNDDDDNNKVFPTLEAGTLKQIQFVKNIASGLVDSYSFGKLTNLKAKYSKEIANHPEQGLPYNLPGYKFIFTGQLDQYVKIYATGARAGNGYINTIVSYFRQNGVIIKPSDKIQDIIAMK